MSKRVVFISGHCNLSNLEFEEFYKSQLDALLSNPVPIVIGNAYGCDTISFEYLIKNQYPHHLITVYHYGTGVPISYYPKTIKTISNFTSYTKRDAAMTLASTEDLLWVRPEEQTKALIESQGKTFSAKRKTGTELNRLRRKKQ